MVLRKPLSGACKSLESRFFRRRKLRPLWERILISTSCVHRPPFGNDPVEIAHDMSIGHTPSFQARLRKFVKESPALIRTIQAARASIHFGPWRHAARAAIRWRRPPRPVGAVQTPSRVPLATPELVRTLKTDGTAQAGLLPSDMLRRLRSLVDELPPGEYGDAHEHPDVRDLVFDADVMAVVRGYLGAEPELLECNIVVGHAEDPEEADIAQQRHFHFDFAGWQSLNLFVYLTDADEMSGGHQVVVGTHRNRSLRDAVRHVIGEDEILTRFPGRLRTILGPAGTMFFEDTESFHRRLILTRRRVLLNVLYASHRSWASEGRLVPKFADSCELKPA